jgi:hypothetical protein
VGDTLTHLVIPANLIGLKDKPHFAACLFEKDDLLIRLHDIRLISEDVLVCRDLWGACVGPLRP